MKLAVRKNHLGRQILEKTPVGPKKRRLCKQLPVILFLIS